MLCHEACTHPLTADCEYTLNMSKQKTVSSRIAQKGLIFIPAEPVAWQKHTAPSVLLRALKHGISARLGAIME